MNHKCKEFEIEAWDSSHRRWVELMERVEAVGQSNWVEASFRWHVSSHLLVALVEGAIAGFLRYVVQEIGPELDRPPVLLHGRPLLEAKVLAFGVIESYRNQGIGRRLQEAAIAAARERGCYQLRSHSSGENQANHQLKLAMGFAVHPISRGHDNRGAYFVLPLQGQPG